MNRGIFLISFLAIAVGIGACRKSEQYVTGASIFQRYCATCHQEDGRGIEGAFPPLVDSEWVRGDAGRMIRLVIRGMQGPITVGGTRYNNVMTPHGFLTDAQIASVITYARDEFGHGASAVDSLDVGIVRASIGKGPLYQASDLESMTGIPGVD